MNVGVDVPSMTCKKFVESEADVKLTLRNETIEGGNGTHKF